MKKISVIVPVYNVEQYLKRCIESILGQTYKNLEVILVNDGSTDSSLEICKQYQNNSRVTLLNKKNGGLSSARNMGLEHATGDYVAFIDSDDWIKKDIYEHCMSLFTKYDCDIVDFKPIFMTTEDEPVDDPKSYTFEVIEKDKVLEDYLLKGQTEKTPFSVCRKVYKKECVETTRFREGIINEDIIFNFEVLKQKKKLVHTSKVGYFYFQSPDSMTRDGLQKKNFDLLYACNALKEMSVDENKTVNYLVDVKTARSYFSLLAKIAFYGVNDESINEKKVTKELTRKLRTNYSLLMKSPMPVNRKLMATALSIHMNLLRYPLTFYKKVKGI